ncbi:cadherin-related family member 2 isoform X2 [Etheostoma spectabile]|uniref:cadherin-related family member 2 isoform X2 n=1 Tax=Etheostoma spectabile TaxID=54343 RepID=UPI0013AF1126|nr:cadherin-related family member 2 isoform X2 [Etheostoma spectabile]
MSSGMEGVTGSILLLCLISFTNANTSPTINSIVRELCEDTPIGAYGFTIEATDAENDPLTYSLREPNAQYFTVESSTGRVSVSRKLDREASNVLPLGVGVSDGPNFVERVLTVVLKDANDNRPIFQDSSYDIEIPENTPVNTLLFKAVATDADTSSASIVRYNIDEVTPNDGFSLFSIVPTTGEVRLNGSLNFTALSTFYRLKINATDGGGQCYFDETNYFSSIAFSFVTVVDVPDLDPVFVGTPYVGNVEENSFEGESVFKVTAIDRDTGINDAMIYSIENSTVDHLFEISATEGDITVLSHIDRELIGDTVSLTVKATESKENIHGVFAHTTTTVQINIIDINDNWPEFYKCGLSCVKESHFTGEVVEHSLSSVSFNMTVKDLDKTSKTKLTLEGEDKDVFSVEPQFTISDSIVQFLVKQPQQLDFEKKQQMILQVIATDEETNDHSTATVTINIKDANDNSPKFQQDTYKLAVAEHSPVGEVLGTITAEDPDTMDQGNITYKLLPESILLYFDVEPHTGTIFVKNSTLLDREVRSLYSATLQARDTDDKPGTTVLEITVTDINDHAPVINRDYYQEFVKEGGELELKIEATDADDSETENSKIVFGIDPSRYSDNFTIDPNTGVLRNKDELDREALDPKLKGRIELNVTATDKGSPPLSTMVTVIIIVEDVNDNTPQFEASKYKFAVKEGELGAFVGSVQAEDLDQTAEFNRISFRIIEGSFGSFIIRTYAEERGYRGNITVDPDIELDYESARKQFHLRVEATDLEQKMAVVMVEVDVLDVNDERPEFKPTAPVTVKENTTISGPVGHFTAQDKDGNHSLEYELESVKCRCNGSLTPCSWFILDPTGDVRVNPEQTTDYEKCDQVLIEAQVVDQYTEKGENNSVTTGQMVINIADINDNAPEFIFSDSVFVVVSESASKGTSVAGVTATDRDSGTNRQIDFKVTAVQFKDNNNQVIDMKMLFDVVTTQQNDFYVGIIQTSETLDTSLKGKYLVTVIAKDTGDLSTSTVLEIFAVDDSYKVELEFTRSQAFVEENLNEIIRALMTATKAAVEIAAIRSDTSEAFRASEKTIIVAYFVFSNGTALTSNEVEKMISDPQHSLVLIELGLADIGKAPLIEPETDPVRYILLGMVAGLVIVLAVLTTSLMCTRRNYRRKLKAAKAMNSASMVTSDNQKSGPVVPGTNKYTMEGANPVLNLNIDTTLVLDMDEDSSDVDKVSLDSLDDNHHMTMSEKDRSMMIEEEEAEYDSRLPEYIEPLGAALAQRGQKKGSDNAPVGFNNPAFNTTDL